MFITLRSKRPIGEVRQKFEDASTGRKFGVQAIHNVKATLEGKGLVFDRRLYIYEICNPGIAKKVLDTDIRISTALPCRVSIYADGDDVVLETLKPTMLADVQRAVPFGSRTRGGDRDCGDHEGGGRIAPPAI